jgi:hypothetical protein
MMTKRVITDLAACKRLWDSFVQIVNLSDFWDFRFCFHKHYQHRLHFLTFEERQEVLAVLPLVHIPDKDIYVFFPGETWNGKTWLERTFVYCKRPQEIGHFLSACPERTYLRYVDWDDAPAVSDFEIDEIGYVLRPQDFTYDLEAYYKRFTWKKLKAIKKEIASLLSPGSSWHINRLSDYHLLVNLNLGRFGDTSYFYDTRFTESFRDAMHMLAQRGWLRMVSLEIGGETVAVDMGALFNNTFVVFVGGTHPDFPGVAKVMNMQHIEFACQHRVSKVDFLCGDFYWKKLWHLDPQPLYKYVSPALKSESRLPQERQELDLVMPMAEMGAAGF